MIAFDALSALARAAFALWALLLCLTCIVSALLCAMNKRTSKALWSVLLCAPVYFLWQVIFDYALNAPKGETTPVTDVVCALPLPLWILTFAGLTVLAIRLLILNVDYDKNHITPGSVKIFLDKTPCGVCCFKDNGRVLFSNVTINDLCRSLTGEALLDGRRFSDAVRGGILPVGDRMWRFTTDVLTFSGERLHEIFASDITDEYKKTETLEKDKADLSRIKAELQEYMRGIDDAVRKNEILNAKVNIHDEMNRLMLTTAAANVDDTAGLDRIFSLWEENALLLCMEAGGFAASKETEEIEKLAAVLKIALVWQGFPPASLSGGRRSLFFAAAQEALVNAAKHAGASTMTITVTEDEAGVACYFTNDGVLPEKEVRFAGGLANLSLLAEKQRASLSVMIDRQFTLSLSFPKDKNQPDG